MATAMESMTLSVEEPVAGVVVIRVGGELNRDTAPRLARLLDGQLDHCAGLYPATTDRRAHLIVDLAGVRNFAGGLSVLRHAQHTGDLADVGVHLTGLGGRAELLPGWAAEFVAQLGGFPSTEEALTATLT